MDNRKETFTRYGKDFQEKLCRLMIEDRPFCDQMEEVLDVEFLKKHTARKFIIIMDYRSKNTVHIQPTIYWAMQSKEILQALIQRLQGC